MRKNIVKNNWEKCPAAHGEKVDIEALNKECMEKFETEVHAYNVMRESMEHDIHSLQLALDLLNNTLQDSVVLSVIPDIVQFDLIRALDILEDYILKAEEYVVFEAHHE